VSENTLPRYLPRCLGGDQPTGLVGPRVELHISWMETDGKGIVPVEREIIFSF